MEVNTMKKAKNIGCKTMSLRACPYDPFRDTVTCGEIKMGEIVKVDTRDHVWSWDDQEFYKVVAKDGKTGYANSGCLEFIGGDKRGQYTKYNQTNGRRSRG